MRIGLDSYTYHRLLGELRPGEEDPGERLADGGATVISEARALGVDWARLAATLGCRLMRVVAGGPRQHARAYEWPAAVAPLQRAAEHARGLGLELALENHGDLNAAQIDALLDAVAHPALGVCFDTANAPLRRDRPARPRRRRAGARCGLRPLVARTGCRPRGRVTVMAVVDKGDNVERKLRLGVIGAGSWAVASHLPNFATREEVEFVGVARKGRDLLEKVKDDFGFQVASEDYRDVIDAGLDICLVSSPTAHHHEHAKAALEAGAHVLVEKPVTIGPAEAWDLVETADRAGLHLVCSFGWNFLPMLQNAKRLMEDQGVGEVEHLVVHMSSATRELLSNTGAYPDAAPESVPEQRTWTDPQVSGGGYGQAQLSHALGLSLWLTGLRGQEAFAYMSTILDSPVEHYDAFSMRFANGAIGTMAGGSAHLGYDGNKHELALRVIGSEGHFACDLQRELVWLYRAGGEDVRLPVQPNDALYNCDGPPNTLVDLALGRDVRNWAPGELGARTVEILDAAYRSAASGKPEPVRESAGP